MNYAFIKDDVCINTVVFDNEETVINFKESMKRDGLIDDIVLAKDGFSVGDSYRNGIWSKSAIPLDLLKQDKINQTHLKLKEFLENNPLQFIDGKYYSVTEEHQSRLTSAIAAYDLELKMGIANPVLEWNDTGEQCTEWPLENLAQLAITIKNYVTPKVKHQRDLELAIKASTTLEELEEIVINYDNV